jgi:uncharacterized protein (TIGR02246 family)
MAHRDLLETLFEAWNSHDALRSSACFAPEAVYREAGGREVVGRPAIVAHFAAFFRSGPPWRFEVDDLLLDGDRAAVVYRFAIRGDGPDWRERAGCAVVRFEAGLISLWHEYHG